MMTEFYVVYRNLEDWEGDEFELLETPQTGGMLIKEQIIPGEFGFKDVVIRHYHRHIKHDAINLTTYTHTELKQFEVRDIANQALRWAKEQAKN